MRPGFSAGVLLALCILGLATDADAEPQAGGAITGRVTTAAGGTPLVGARVTVYSSTGGYVDSVLTGGDGRYVTSVPLGSGTYYLDALAIDYPKQVYREITCGMSCQPTAGTPVSVTLGATTENIDFPLVSYPVVTGTVTAAAGGAPMAGVLVSLTVQGAGAGMGWSDTSGVYRISVNALAGPAYATAAGPQGYHSQVYNGVDCDRYCPSDSGTALALTLGTTTSGIDFSLVHTAVISGTVTAKIGGASVAGATVTLWSSSGSQLETVTTGADGSYATTEILGPGTYYLSATAGGYRGQIFNGIDCPGACSNVTSGTPVTVTRGVNRPGTDFALAAGSGIAGTVTRASNGAPIVGIDVYAASLDGSAQGIARTGADGSFAMSSLAPGSYHVYVHGFSGTLGLVYGGPDCASSCKTPITGTPVTVTAGAITPGIDLVLFAPGVISGRVTAADGAPLAGVDVTIYSPAGSPYPWLGSATTDSDGNYSTAFNLGSGDYYARASLRLYASQIYRGIDCGMPCPPASSGTAIAVTHAATTPGVDFVLARGGSITGTVTARGVPVPGVNIDVYTATDLVAWTATDANGIYRTETVLPTGTYYVKAFGASGHLDQIYSGINCGTTCPSPSTGTPVAVTQATTTGGIDFALVIPGWITGSVMAAEGGPLAGAMVDVLRPDGSQALWVTTDAGGAYNTPHTLVPGTYFLQARAADRISQVYNGINCLSECPSPPSGTAVTVVDGQATPGINFSLGRGGRISGTVTASSDGRPLAGIAVWIFPPTADDVAMAVTDANGFYTTTAPIGAGTYYLLALELSEEPLFREQVYRGVNCTATSCPELTSGTPVTVVNDATTGGIDFALVAASSPSYTDDPLEPGTVSVKAVHITELRQAIDTLRARRGLGAFSWTDATLTPGVTPVKAAHLAEMRSALEAVYASLGRPLPAWSPAPVEPGKTVITAAAIRQLRSAVAAIW